jgi:hypothetical protein
MSHNLDYLGKDLKEGLTNYIFFPERICAVMDYTCELIPVRELRRRSEELLSKRGLF